MLDTGVDAIKSRLILKIKIADAVTKTNDDKTVKPDENPRNVEEIIIPPEERDQIFNKLRKVL